MAEDNEHAKLVRHDIRNQLSNINLALEQLRHDIRPMDEDIKFYLDTISSGCSKINELLASLE